MSKKKAAPKKCSSKCNKRNCGTQEKCNNKKPPVNNDEVEIRQSKSNYFYGLIKKAFGYESDS